MANVETGLRIGHITYLNCVPWFHFFQQGRVSAQLISGVPAQLNTLLQERQIDVSPSSSFEYAQHFHDYLLLPGHSISSVGPVRSVLLFSPCELAELAGVNIAITGESATSINLLRLILREFYGLEDVADAVPAVSVEEVVAQGQPALLIGDRALRLASQKPAAMKIFDLGEIWYQQTGLPFVFALWMIRKTSLQNFSGALAELSAQLTHSYEKVMQAPQQVAELYAGQAGLPVSLIVDYWQSIDCRLDKAHLEGMDLFFQLCVKHNLLLQVPRVEFFQSSTAVMPD